MEVDVNRLRRDIESNGQFGATDTDAGRGRTVLTGSEAEKEARNYFIGQLEAAGLDITIDAIGNIVGRWTPDSANSNAAPVAAGSHLDSVPAGGIFDGPLGVYAALEAVRTMQTAKVQPARPIDVVCFTEEEGQRFDTPLLGSKVAAESYSVVDALSLTDDRGETLDSASSSIADRGQCLIKSLAMVISQR